MRHIDLSSARLNARQWGTVALTLILGIVFTLVGFLLARQIEIDRAAANFHSKTAEYTNLLQREVSESLHILNSFAALYYSSVDVSRQEFARFAGELMRMHSSIDSLRWIPRVPHKDRESYLRAAQVDGFMDFRISEKTEAGRLQKIGERSEYFPIYYVAPQGGNEAILGFDVSTDPVRLPAMNLARDTNMIVATQAIRLIEQRGESFGFLVFQPIYRIRESLVTVPDRRQHLDGFIAAAFQIGTLIESALRGTTPAGIDIAIYDTAAGQPELIYFHPSRKRHDRLSRTEAVPPGPDRNDSAATLKVADRQWKIFYGNTVYFDGGAGRGLPLAVLLGGLAATLLLFLSVLSLVRRGARLKVANLRLEEDIAERKKIENLLRENEERFRELYENLDNGVAVYRAVDGGDDFVIEQMNRAGHRIARLKDRNVHGKLLSEVFPSAVEAGLMTVVRQVWQTGRPESFSLTVYRDNRLRYWADNYVYKLSSGVVVAIFNDITQRKQADEELKMSSKRWAATFNAMTAGVCLLDAELKILQSNQAMGRIFDKAPEKMQGQECSRLLYGNQPPPLNDPLGRMRATLLREQSVISFGKRWLEITVDPIVGPSGELQGAVHVAADITDRKKAETTLLQREALLRYMGQVAKVGGWEFDAETLKGTWTEEVARIHDLPPDEETNVDLGLSFYEEKSRDKVAAAIQEAIENGKPYDLELELVSALGVHKWVRTIGFPVIEGGKVVRVRGAFQDISESKEAEEEKARLEAQLRQSQKLEAMGTLAGGIAHDFNNILAAIMGYSELAVDEVEPGSEARESLEHILAATIRARKLIEQILAFSRKAEVEMKPLELNHHLNETIDLIKKTIPKMVDVELHLADNLRLINSDSGQIEQVVMNLATNAADAMDQGGRLVIETDNASLNAEYCREHLEAKPGEYVRLQVSDTGHGIPKEVLSQIFDPFFTTKEAGKGTGLGLSTVYGIVKTHGGFIYCYSEPGQGTTFRIYLPALKSNGGEERAKAGAKVLQLSGGEESILLVDDEQALRNLGDQMLSRAGYAVSTADCGEEALEMYREAGGYDLVILDVSMPGMGGHNCLVELRKLDPKARVLVASGYSLNGHLKDTLAAGAAGYLAKPFERTKMLEKVRQVLDAPPPGSA